MTRTVAPVVVAGSMAKRRQPVLAVNDQLMLRPWGLGDAEVAMAAFEVDDIRRWHIRRLGTIEEAHAWIQAMERGWECETSATWAIAADHEATPIGRMALTRIDLDGGWAEVAYWLLPNERGRGVVSASLEAMTQWAFHDLGLHRIELEHSVHNAASCAVAERACFDLEGTLRQRVLHADGWHDMHLHARLAPLPTG